MAAAAVSCGFRPVLLGHHVLDSLEDRIHRRIAVRTGFPLLVDLCVTSSRATRGGTRERSWVESTVGRGVGEARRKRAILPKWCAVVRGELIPVFGSGVHQCQRHNEADSSNRRSRRDTSPGCCALCEPGPVATEPGDKNVWNGGGQSK